MDQEVNQEALQKPQLMEDDYTETKNDLFEQFLIQTLGDRSMEIERIQKPMHSRSSKTLNRRSDFSKILNSSSSNDRLIPSSINNGSSRENSEGSQIKCETQHSVDSESFRESFKKKFEESFSVSHTVRHSSSSFSERSDKSSRNIIIIPQVYKQEQQSPFEQKKLGCHCKRSRCLKLYCQCFQKQMYCSKSCSCQSCGNNEQNKEQHKQAIIEALARNAHVNTHGFWSEEKVQTHKVLDNAFSLGIDHGQVRKGCKCKRTKCLKKYCECYQSGVICTIFCRCQECFNKQIRPNGNNLSTSQFTLLTNNI